MRKVFLALLVMVLPFVLGACDTTEPVLKGIDKTVEVQCGSEFNLDQYLNENLKITDETDEGKVDYKLKDLEYKITCDEYVYNADTGNVETGDYGTYDVELVVKDESRNKAKLSFQLFLNPVEVEKGFYMYPDESAEGTFNVQGFCEIKNTSKQFLKLSNIKIQLLDEDGIIVYETDMPEYAPEYLSSGNSCYIMDVFGGWDVELNSVDDIDEIIVDFDYDRDKKENDTTLEVGEMEVSATSENFSANAVVTNVDIVNDAKIKIPIGKLASLGAGVSSLIPAFRTITDTITFSGPKLYEIANMGIGDVLKTTKAGISYGAIKTPDGVSKMAQLKEAGTLSATSTSVAAFNPATIMMAAALFSIDQKLGSIMENEKKILSHLKFEKESSVEGDLKTLNSIIKEYKYNWDNESFVRDHHKMALDIKRTSLAHIGSYQKEIESILTEEKAIIVKANVSAKLQELKEQFMYYRLSIYTFTLASFIEVMLSENYKEENILGKEEAIEKYSLEYRKLFTKSASLIEKLSKKSIEGTLLRGIGNTGKVAGSLIANIPLIKEGPVDELLLKGGEALKNSSEKMSEQYTWSFGEMADPNTSIFLEKLDDMIYIYNKTSRICFDLEQIYLIAE